MEERYDFIAIGDIATDAFIRIKEAHVNCDINRETCQLCIAFGEKIPYEFVEVVPAVGNSANAAVSAARLGLTSALVAHLGDDAVGKTSLDSLKNDKVDTKFIGVHKGMKSNYHYVLWYEAERTILVKHEKYPYRLPDIGTPRWIYLSSLGDQSLVYHQEISRYLKDHPEIKLAFQPGTFQITLGTSKLHELYERTELFFCNVEEARKILNTNTHAIGSLLSGIHSLGPKIVVITDGPKGGYVYDGKEMWFMPPYPDPKPPYERTGAGDAFASTVTSGVALGLKLEEALQWGNINAMSVVQYIGAQKGLLTKDQIKKLLSEAPQNYHVTKLV